jgi:chromosome segregation protein
VKLKRLVIQGFKSFKDRTTVHFDEGITGIVGPNGCGKSNIVDALFWVMGEQSAKHLRGKSMKDLIFAGSSKYSPGSFAEATLVLENDDGKHIHIGNKVCSPSEIQLTRKLYRNGDTEYRINNEPARLRDIQEVFMDTGAGAKSYSIIAQGEINRLVQAKPEERRVMIEEVAGITKFKMRKRESLRKIEATQANLSRLNDLQIEIEKNLRSLQKQAERAERARNLKEKIKKNDLVVHSHKVFESLRTFRDDRSLLKEHEVNVESWKTKKDTLEISLEDERHQKDEQTDSIDELQKEYNEISRTLAAAEEKLNYLVKSKEEKENQIETRKKEAVEIEQETQHRLKRLEELHLEQESIEEQRLAGFDCEELEQTVENLKDALEIKNDQLDNLQEDYQTTKDELVAVEQVVFRSKSRLDEFAGSLQDITEEVESLEGQYSGVSKDIADERDQAAQAEELSEKLEREEGEQRVELSELKESLKSKEAELKSFAKEHIQIESRLESLRAIKKSLDGSQKGASELLKTYDDGRFNLLGNLIKCDDKYTQGVQALLKNFLNVILCSDNAKDDLENFLKEKSHLGLEVLSPCSGNQTTEETIERLRLKGMPDIVSLFDVVTIEGEFASQLKNFFLGFYLVPDLSRETASKLEGEIAFKAITSIDGELIVRNLGGAKSLQFIDGNDQGESAVERNNKIDVLSTELEELTVRKPILEDDVSSFTEKLEAAHQSYDDLRERLLTAKADAATKTSALASKLANMEAGHARLDILKNRKTEISKQRLEILENEESEENKLTILQDKIEEHSNQISDLKEEVELQRDSYNSQREELLEKQVQAKSFDERVRASQAQVVDVEGQIDRQKLKVEQIEELIAKLFSDIESDELAAKDLEGANQDCVSDLESREDILSTLKDQLSELLHSMQERETVVKKLTSDINKVEKEMTTLESRLVKSVEDEEFVVRNIFEKYHIDLRNVLGAFLEYQDEDYTGLSDLTSMYSMETEQGVQEISQEDYEFTRRFGKDLKECEYRFRNYKTDLNRLGEINWQAIEDYDRQKLRFDFLKIQESELKKSLEDLETAIGHIDEKSKKRFATAFEEVDTRFRKVFPIIFGGGNAELKLTGDLSDPECGVEIIAQPPGKKMQNINLMSGGEKAMTAVSLIFSIFLVKPSPFCLLDEVDAPLDDANVGRFNELLREMSNESQFILITHNKKTMELNDTLYGVTMQEPGISKAVSVQLH